MILQAIAFYVFAFVTMASGAMVVVSRNPIYSVLFLILAFFNAAALFLLLGAEFIAMILIIVYVGAVAVLFLFVVMMLDVDFGSLRAGFARYLPAGLVVAGVLLAEMVLVAGAVANGITPEEMMRVIVQQVPTSFPDARLSALLHPNYRELVTKGVMLPLRLLQVARTFELAFGWRPEHPGDPRKREV